jgi:DNA-binding FadR family transcriptional regulator
MHELLKPIKTESLKDVCIARLEALILSGKLHIGQKLPSERELALQLGVSRPVVHEGLVDLAAKGLVSMRPRVGTVVNDFRKEGSLALLTALVNHNQGMPDLELLKSLLEMRMLFEVETARLAALNRKKVHLRTFDKMIEEEQKVDIKETERISELDFKFHHTIAMASGNIIYPLLLNSFKQFYLNLAGQFFSDPAMATEVFRLHRDLVFAVRKRDEQQAIHVMQCLLGHGELHLKKMISDQSQGDGELTQV